MWYEHWSTDVCSSTRSAYERKTLVILTICHFIRAPAVGGDSEREMELIKPKAVDDTVISYPLQVTEKSELLEPSPRIIALSGMSSQACSRAASTVRRPFLRRPYGDGAATIVRQRSTKATLRSVFFARC